MNSFQYCFNDIEIPDFNPEFFDLWLTKVVEHYQRGVGEISFVYCSDEALLEINSRFLNHHYYTDVITFNYNDEHSLNGEIFISYERVTENAVEFGNGNVFDELCRVMVHGILHLVGFADYEQDDKRRMTEQENQCLLKR